MTRIRLDLAGAHLRELYTDLRTEGLRPCEIDSGYAPTDYSRLRSRSTFERSDSRIQSAELFEGGLTHLGSSRFNPLYQRSTGANLPWLILNTTTLANFDEEIARWRRYHPGEISPTEELARHIYDWVQSSAGLGVHPQDRIPELSADEAIFQQRADCTEFVKIFLCLLSRAGFSPYPVWVGVDRNGSTVQHFATGIDVGDHTVLLDPVYREFNSPHRSYLRISLREFLAWHWNNLALDLAASPSASSTLSAFNQALEIDPRNPHIFLNRGIFYAAQGDRVRARRDFDQSLRIDGQFHAAYYELGNLDFDAHHFRSAIRNYRRALQLSPESRDYQTNLSLALGHLRMSARTSRSSSHPSRPCE
jgi:hypothetical protein